MPNSDIKQLRILSVLYFAFAVPLMIGFTILSYLAIFLIHHFIENLGNAESAAYPSETLSSWSEVILLSSILILSWTWVTCLILAGIKLWQRKSRTFCTIVAGLTCISFPLGTLLGVVTLIVLSKESVKDFFAGRRREKNVESGIGQDTAGHP